ncbi:hypothetical protein BH10PSE12_BH10PSE12_36490 [soil metagenome]
MITPDMLDFPMLVRALDPPERKDPPARAGLDRDMANHRSAPFYTSATLLASVGENGHG